MKYLSYRTISTETIYKIFSKIGMISIILFFPKTIFPRHSTAKVHKTKFSGV